MAKKGKTWKFGKKAGVRGSVSAALKHHPDKFSKEACKKGGDGDKLCPYAIFSAMAKKKKVKSTYKDQPTTSKKAPKKKKKLKENSFVEYLSRRNPKLLD